MKGFDLREGLKNYYDSYYDSAIGREIHEIAAIGRATNIVSSCSGCPHDTLLEIGCGKGLVLEELSRRGFGIRYFGLEVSDSAVERTISRNIRGMVECQLFDGYSIPYEGRRFDLAILSHVLEHVEFPRKLLYEAGRVANYVFVEVPLEDNIRLRKDFVLGSIGHINFYTEKTIRFLIQTSGFEVVSQSVSNESLAYFKRGYGKKWLVYFAITEIPFRVIPPIALKLFNYNCSMLCKPSGA